MTRLETPVADLFLDIAGSLRSLSSVTQGALWIGA